MLEQTYYEQQNNWKHRTMGWLADQWPMINGWINDFFWGVINFFKLLITAIWR